MQLTRGQQEAIIISRGLLLKRMLTILDDRQDHLEGLEGLPVRPNSRP